MLSGFWNKEKKYYRCLWTSDPSAYLFYAVARVGPDGSHRPVAVASWPGKTRSSSSSSSVAGPLAFREARACLRLVTIFSATGNRVAVEAELGLATVLYADEATRQDVDGLVVFPVLSTCLLVGLGFDASHDACFDPQLEPLHRAYQDASPEYGAGILDITNLDNVRVGILAFPIHRMGTVALHPRQWWDTFESPQPNAGPVPVVDEQRPRVPKTLEQYLRAFQYASWVSQSDQQKRLRAEVQAVNGVEEGAADYIWPASNDARRSPMRQRSFWSRREAKATDTKASPTQNGPFWSGQGEAKLLIDQVVTLDEPTSGNAEACSATAKLLRWSYAGVEHLNWTLFRKLSYQEAALALESPELAGAASLSICVDRMEGDLEALLRALCQQRNLQHICFLQDPKRVDDDATALVFLSMANTPAYAPLLCRDCTFTCAYSSPLRLRFWLPVAGPVLPSEAFPLLQILSLTSDGRVGPLPAEAASVPLNPTGDASIECWSKPRDLHATSWTLLVSCERIYGADQFCQTRPAVRYAFVKARRDIIMASGDVGHKKPDPDDIQVCELVGFLAETAPHVDAAAINAILHRTSARIAFKVCSRHHSRDDPPPLECYDEKEAFALPLEFLNDAVHVRDCLRFAMQQPPAPKWYPELLEGLQLSKSLPPHRTAPTFAAWGDRLTEEQLEAQARALLV
ncbi:hypothetical protein IF2G_11043 [Cordyceps javanica]|nr:hypothetical protein IF2G_11043 [Cordyceps javanica]